MRLFIVSRLYNLHITTFFLLITLRPPISTLTYTLFPSTTLFRSHRQLAQPQMLLRIDRKQTCVDRPLEMVLLLDGLRRRREFPMLVIGREAVVLEIGRAHV